MLRAVLCPSPNCQIRVRVRDITSESESESSPQSPSQIFFSSPSHDSSSHIHIFDISLSSKTWKQTKYFPLPHLSSSSFNKLYEQQQQNVSNVNRVEKAQHGTAATAWTRAWLGPSHESRFLSPSPSQSLKKMDSSPSHQKMNSSPSPYSSHTALVMSVNFYQPKMPSFQLTGRYWIFINFFSILNTTKACIPVTSLWRHAFKGSAQVVTRWLLCWGYT